MRLQDQQLFWHNHQLNIGLLRATYVDYEFPPHTHDHYVICLIEWGTPAFFISGTRYVSPPRGLIFINPGEVHTGESATESGIKVRSLYPTVTHMQSAMSTDAMPLFTSAYVDEPTSTRAVFELHQRLVEARDPLEQETLLVETLHLLAKRHANLDPGQGGRFGRNKQKITQAKQFLEERYAVGVSLQELADHTGYNKHYLLRAFRNSVGMPPHEYLQNIRIQRAQQMIRAGKPLTDVGAAVGLCDQSHLNRLFKRFTGVTPGFYAQQVRI